MQAIAGDEEGAKITQENFIRQCPLVSQVTSLVQVARGNKEAAKETQKQCLGTINGFVNGIPVVGHVKAGIHLVAGDKEGAKQAFQSSTRTTG